MSTETRWTPEQLRGVTNTDTSSSDGTTESDDGGAWTEDLEVAVYGESDWLLPGYGDRPESCGRYYAKEFCEKCGEPHFGKSRCQNRACPNCWVTWSGDRTVAAVARLAAAREAAEKAADKRAVHAVVSPPEGSVQSKREFYEAFREGYNLAGEHGVRGGLVVPHGYRIKKDAKEKFRAQEKYKKAWRFVRENGTHWRDQVYWSPHFHVIGLGRYEDMTAGDADADEGWVFKKIDTLERFEGVTDTEGFEDMASRIRYLLSHATFEKDAGKAVVRWYGEVAPGAFSAEGELSKGKWDAIQRRAEEIVGGGDLEGEGGAAGGEEERCDREGCDGTLRSIFEAKAFLRQRRKKIDEERAHRLETAFRWAVGDAQPPPGAKYPRTEKEARESLETML